MTLVPMCRGNGLRKVEEKDVAAHLEHGWVKFADAGEALKNEWLSKKHLLDPSVVELIDPPAPRARRAAAAKSDAEK